MDDDYLVENKEIADYYEENILNEDQSNDLQDRLYAQIYYQSNIDFQPEISDISKTIKLNDIIDRTEKKQENIQHKKSVEPKITTSPYSKQVKLQELHSTEDVESITETSTQVCSNSSTDQQTQNTVDIIDSNYSSPVELKYNYINNEISNHSLPTKSIVNKKNSLQNLKLHNHLKIKDKIKSKDSASSSDSDMDTKYNVSQKNEKQKVLVEKNKQALKNISESEESILEVPLSPKPAPLLINLQDSDKEDNANPVINKNVLPRQILSNKKRSKKKRSKVSKATSPDLEIIYESVNGQDTFPKCKTINKSPCNKNISQRDKNIHSTQNIVQNEYIIDENFTLNCTYIKSGARSIKEIRHLSRSAKGKKQSDKCVEDMSKRFKKKSPQTATFSGRNSQQRETQQNFNTNSIYYINDQNLMNNQMMNASAGMSCDQSNLMENHSLRKRRCEGVESYDQKRNRSWQNDRNTETTLRISDNIYGKEKHNESFWNEYFFKPMSKEQKKYYDSLRGQENFTVSELQSGMSKDPRIWATLKEDVERNRSIYKINGGTWYDSVKCGNCRKGGHLRINCDKSPTCYICGVQGHMEKHCSQKMCLTCGTKQNSLRRTCEYCHTLYCTMCKSVGHTMQQCPDLWRRYHQTTESGRIPQNPGNVMKPANQLYCCNCTKRGHESSKCTQYQWSDHFSTPAAVTSYTNGPAFSMHASNVSIESELTNISGSMDTNSNTNRLISKKVKNIKNINFTNIIYSYGTFNQEDAEIIVENLSFYQRLNLHAKLFVNDLVNGKFFPAFFEKLHDSVKFKATIGWVDKKSGIILQLIGGNYTKNLFRLLVHWLNLSSDDKRYRADLNLPINPIELCNFLKSKMSEFRHNFISPFKIVKDIDVWSNKFQAINPNLDVLFHLTKFKYKLYTFSQYLHKLRTFKSDQFCTKFYLQIVINYNYLFGNSEPFSLPYIAQYILQQKENESKKEISKQKSFMADTEANSSIPLTTSYMSKDIDFTEYPSTSFDMQHGNYDVLDQQQIDDISATSDNATENNTYYFQNLIPLNTEPTFQSNDSETKNLSIPLTTSYMSEDIDFTEYPYTSFDMQHGNYDVLDQQQIDNNISATLNDATKNNTYYFQNLIPLNTEPTFQSNDSETKNNYPPTYSINIRSNLETSKSNIKSNRINDEKSLSTAKINLEKFQQKKKKNNKNNDAITNDEESAESVYNLYRRAEQAVNKAYNFQLPYMIKAADDLRRKMNNQTFEEKNIEVLEKLCIEYLSTSFDTQHGNYNVLDQQQIDDISATPNDATENNTYYFQNSVPLNTEPTFQSNDSETKNNYPSTYSINTRSNLQTSKSNVNSNRINDEKSLSTAKVNLEKFQQKKKKKKKKKNKKYNAIINGDESSENIHNLYRRAEKALNKAYNFQLPCMIKEAQLLQSKVNNRTLKEKNIRLIQVLEKLINLKQKKQRKTSKYTSDKYTYLNNTYMNFIRSLSN